MHGFRALCLSAILTATARAQPDGGAVFDEAWSRVRDAFYDPSLRGVDWDAVRGELRPRAQAADSAGALSAIINEALGHLRSSHTQHYHSAQAAYYELRDVFSEGRGTSYLGIGIATAEVDGRTFVADIYDGGPAGASALRTGDEIVAVGGEEWADVESFRDRQGLPTVITIRREGPGDEPRDLVVTPEQIQPHELFLASIHASARLIRRGDASIAYVRVRSYSSPEYHEAVMGLLRGEFADADALILDIRGGWGGARAAYMSLANPVAPTMQWRRRGDADWTSSDDAWHKPIVLLIDGGSRSGKEMLAFAYKKHGLATLVGERTAGAVLAGQATMLSDGSLLYVAVADVMVDGVRLEGVGVEPDVAVGRSLPYSAGRDPQLAAAVEEAARLAQIAVRDGQDP